MRFPQPVMYSLVVCLSLSSASHAGHYHPNLAEVEVYDRTARRTLPIHERDGRLYVVGEPRHRYELRIRNRSYARVLAVASVDGVNVVSGETAAEHQSGYVVTQRGLVTIQGWRKDLDEVAAFYFTELADSYAARTGRPDNVGAIGVALFRESAAPCCRHRDRLAQGEAKSSTGDMPASASEQTTSDRDYSAARRSAPLGTGHGQREVSPAEYVDFRRASNTPDETIVIYYDSHRNLVARGVLPRDRLAERLPRPFPHGFVPDP